MQSFFDNINAKVVDNLKVSIKNETKLSIASACFSIYAFEELKSQLQNIEELRFIFTAPSFLKDGESKQSRDFYIPRIDRERALYGSQYEVKLRNQLTQKAIAIECVDWIREKVKFKSNVTSANMLGFINIENDEQATYTPVNGFTTTDLGCEKRNNMFNFVNKTDPTEPRLRDKIRGQNPAHSISYKTDNRHLGKDLRLPDRAQRPQSR